ncbi:MAG: polysaccharide biosynthesis/export family protein [Bryobacterales bacterium]|nr:polysaccharide biosynthesis/export family protein [Bryobacterales bacterium]
MRRSGLLIACLASCLVAVSVRLSAEPAQEQAKEPAPAAPSRAGDEQATGAVGAPIDPKTYVIGAEDVLTIRVWREPELSGPVAVRPDGMISLPLLNDVLAGGLTPDKLSENLKKAFTQFITEPEVMVQVSQVNSKKYFVIGEVGRPGQYQLVVPTTVSQALAIAGGFRQYADTKNVMIIRGPKRYKFNYREWAQGKNLGQNILLESGDQIVVPD